MSAKEYLQKNISYLLVIIIAFYCMPAMMVTTELAIDILLVTLPFVCLTTSFINGFKTGFNPIFAIIVLVLFIPDIYLVFKSASAWLYAFNCAGAALIGNGVGEALRKE